MTPAQVISRQLDDVADLVLAVDETIYTSRPLPDVSGSIGEHVRHILDHIAALVAADPSRPVCYDRRRRGTAVEREQAEALRLIMRLKSAVTAWGARAIDEPICVTAMVAATGDPVTGWSTLGRELAFVTSHTIHHQAFIAVLLTLAGVSAPERLGLAPSTPSKKQGAR